MHVEPKSRRFRLLTQLIALLAVFSLVAAACGDDDAADTGEETPTEAADTGEETPTEAADTGEEETPTPEEMTDNIDTAGVFQMSTDFTTNFGTGFDPATANAPGIVFNEMIFGTLLRRTADGVYHDGLASADDTTILDPSTIQITLLPGQSFTDGTALTAQHVADSIERNAVVSVGGRNMRVGQLGTLLARDDAGTVTGVRDDALEVKDDTTLVINIGAPIAGAWFDLLAHEETMPYIIPDVGMELTDEGYKDATAAAIQADPIGAGPYMLEPGSFVQNDSFTLLKNDGYVHADMINIPTVIWRHVTADALLNALNGSLVDWSTASIATAAQVSADGYSFINLPNPDKFGWLWTACMSPVLGSSDPTLSPEAQAGTLPRTLEDGSLHPLTSVKVRQALNYALDKEAMISQFYGGTPVDPSTVPVMNQLVLNDSPFANPDLVDSYPYDLELALSLLAEEGFDENNKLQLSYAQVGTSTTGEILQAQWNATGVVELELIPSTNTVTEFYIPRGAGGLPDFAGEIAGSSARFFTDKLTRNWQSGVGATCQPNNPEVGGDPRFNEVIAELSTMSPSDPNTIPLWQEAAALVIEPAFGIFFSFPPDTLTAPFENLGIVGKGEFAANYDELLPTQVGIMYPDWHQMYVKAS